MAIIKKILLSIGFFIFLGFIANRILFFKPSFLEKIATTLVYPALWISNQITTYANEIVIKKKSYETISQNLLALQNSYDKLLVEYIALRATIQFDKQAKEIIDFQSRYNMSHALLAKILVKNLTPEEHSIIINRGLRDQIKKDMVAIYKLQIIGKVIDVHDYYSKVLLITDHSCKIAAYANSTNATGIVVGTNVPNRCNLTYVSHLSPIQDNDFIFSSGQGLVFPEGFCLGKIVTHTLKDKALYHHIELEPLIDISSLTFCLLTDQSKINLF